MASDGAQIQAVQSYTVNTDTHGTKPHLVGARRLKDCRPRSIRFIQHPQSIRVKVFLEAFPASANKLNISNGDDSSETKAETDSTWPCVLTQSLEVLHCSLVALQRRVGLGGLVQQHLQSCERANQVSESKCEISLSDGK